MYFLVVGAAVLLAIMTALTWHDVLRVPFFGEWVAGYLDRLLSIFTTDAQALKFGTTAVLSLPFAFILALLLNIPLQRCISLRGRLLLRLSCLSELEEFLWITSLRRLPVMVTLSSAKVYIGYTMDEPPTSAGESKWVRLEPLLSGYRDEHHEFKPTTNYAWMHAASPVEVDEDFQISDFDVLLPVHEIRSVHVFDLPTYASKFQEATTIIRASSSSRVSRQKNSNHPRSKAETAYWGYVGTLLSFPLVELAGGWLSALVVLFMALSRFLWVTFSIGCVGRWTIHVRQDLAKERVGMVEAILRQLRPALSINGLAAVKGALRRPSAALDWFNLPAMSWIHQVLGGLRQSTASTPIEREPFL